MAQKVQPDGTLDGASFIVNSETISTQDQPEIASLNNGALIAVWRTFAENSSTSDVAQTIIDPAAVPAGAMSPVLVGFESVVTLDEQDVNAGLQLVDPDGVISLTDMDSSDFDGGSLLVQRVSGSAGTFEQQLGELDGLGQEQIGLLAGDGVTLSGATVRVDGTAIGTIVEDGTVGAPLRVDFNANATPELVERLLTRLAYANQSDDPAATRQFAVQVSDGEGGSTGSQLLTVEVTPETDLAQASIGPDERVNSYTEGAQDMSASATLFDPNTGLPTGYVVIWESTGQDRVQDGGTGLFGQIYDLDGQPVGGEFQAITHTEFAQTVPAVVGLSGGGFVVAWRDNSWANPPGLRLGETSDGVFGQVFDNAGVKQGGEFLVNQQVSSTQFDVALAALADGGFAASWTSVNSSPAGDGNGNAVAARTFDADGAPRGSEFIVNTTTAGAQDGSDIAQLSNGALAVVYQSGTDILARITDASGVTIVAEFTVNAQTNGSQLSPVIEALDGGGFVVVWQDDSGLDGASSGVFQQVFADDGTAMGPPVRVNETTASSQFDPDVAALPGGGWVVVWTDSSAADGSGQGVFAQVFDVDGSRLDGEVQVNTETSSTQNQPSVSALANGDFMVSFTSVDSGSAGDGSGDGVFQQVFSTPGGAATSDAPIVLGYDTQTTLDEADLNAGLQLIAPNVSVGDMDSADFDGGTLTLTMLRNATVQDAFASPDDAAQDQLGLVTGLGNGISVAGATVRFNGTAIGTIVSDGVDGAEFAIALNAAADATAME
ncbi:MAG: hypothetical protein AAF192_21940, partial [Pseudomonadota bacterium]